MLKLSLTIIGIWLALFSLRLILMGGFDPNFQDTSSISLFEPLRQHLSDLVDQTLPQPQSKLLMAMVLGQERGIPTSFKKDLQTTSTIHLLVVSGQNLSILAGFLMSLVYIFGRRQTAILTLLAILVYSVLTGLGVPIIRAAIMASSSLIAQILGREAKGWLILFLTAALMLLINPNWLLSISFQLSFLATVGVIVASPVVVNYLEAVPQLIRQDLAVTVSAYFLTLPVIVSNFHQLSIVGILTNLLILWTAPLIMISGVVVILVGLISQTLAVIVGLVPTVLLTYFIYIVEFFATSTRPVILIGQTSLVFWLGYYMLVMSGIVYLHIHQLKDRIQK